MPSLVQRGFAVWLRVQEGMRALFARPGVRFALLALVFVGVTAYGAHEALAQGGVTPPATPPAPGAATSGQTSTNQATGLSAPERVMFLMAALFSVILNVLQQLTLTVVNVTIQIMQYNGFATSPVVSAGWAIVRDTVNMFFVIVLIYIAVRIMVGIGHFTIRQQVVPLLIFAIVVNFSKTICALLIDFGQVVMLTFANALKAVAAGNFIQLFGLDALNKVSDTSALITAATSGEAPSGGFQAAQYFGGALGGIIIIVIILFTMVMLFGILAYRIVFLWVLIMLSPMAFFFGGARAAIGDKMYSDWWQKFTCAVAIGPVLTFFVWLTLAVAGSGNLAASEGFTTGLASASQDPVGNLLEIFKFDRFISFVMAIGMLYAGFEAASTVCGGASGTISGLVGRAQGFARKAAIAPAAAAGYVAARGTRKGVEVARRGGAAGLQLTTDLARTAAQRTPGLSRFTDVGARARVEAKLATETDAGKRLKLQQQKDALDKAIASRQRGPSAEWGTMSDDAKAAKMQLLAQKGPSAIPGTKSQQQAEFVEMLKDKKLREKLEKSGDLKKLWDQMGHDTESAMAGNPDAHHAIEGFEESRPDITGKVGDIKSWEDVQKLDKAAFADKRVQDRLKEIETGKMENGKVMTAAERIEKGELGKDKQTNFKEGPAGIVGGMKDEDIAKMPVDQLTAAVTVKTDGTPEENRRSQERVAKLLQDKPAVARRLMMSNAAGAKTALADPAVYQAALKAIGVDKAAGGAIADPAALATAMKENPALLSNFDQSDLAGPTGAAIGNSLDTAQLTDLISRMKSATPKERASMQPMVDNVTKALGEAAKGGNADAVAQLTAFNKQAARAFDRDGIQLNVQIDEARTARTPVVQQRDAVKSQMDAKEAEIRGRGLDPNTVSVVIARETQALKAQFDRLDVQAKKMDKELVSLEATAKAAKDGGDKARENSDEARVRQRLDREKNPPTP